jgi:hypothetical protein
MTPLGLFLILFFIFLILYLFLKLNGFFDMETYR